MRPLLLALALTAAACSSEPETVVVVADTGTPVDARVACGQPGEAVECVCTSGAVGLGRCLPDGRVDPCVCGAVDGGSVDAADSGGAREDVAESSPDVAVDAREELERALCLSGAPRLAWKGEAGCYDTTKVIACRFRVAADGKTRCLPRESAVIGGYSDATCTSTALDWSTEPVPVYLRVNDQVVKTRRGGRSTPWYQKSGTSCVAQSGVLPYGLPMTPSGDYGDAIYVDAVVADGEFYAASL